ncbi:MAG: DUF2007 domain-containing protein [Alishewanella agri]|jgi:hypothetical protein|uniref:putative signal transducing protein n=1 Tax=Alishewanella sp. WH16-1 TaxID=1651088 RepID=UPI00070FFD22|nr:DUF2007 domain-containing protein [Alishewanella sp. WH16-1]KRS22915.1 hypothetical protein AAY72_00720 [Alishewanella sp. WH16-1]MDD4864291.1 DUF2007 domain-containing protein [Alishewanella agri]OYW93444.1 MAG: hypothetical protein B7Z18_06580 [Alishewanella sp. 32-51-5]
MKIIFRANDILEAHIIAGMLNSQGVETYVGGHYLQGAVGDLAALGFANVFVADEQAEQAEQLLQDYQQAELVDFPLTDEDGLAPAG